MAGLAADAELLQVSTGDWSRRADRIESQGDRWEAQIPLRRRGSLKLEWRGEEPIYVSLWSGDARDSAGAAVIVSRRGFEGMKTVPVCGCGVQGCADATYQFRGSFLAEDLPELLAILDSLPNVGAKLGDSNFWRSHDFEEVIERERWPDRAAK